MLRLSSRQLKVFENAAAADADTRLADYARRRFEPELAGQTDAEVERLAQCVRRDAYARGVTCEADVATALDLTVMYGPAFYDEAWASDVFAVADWDGARKMSVLRQRVRRQVKGF